MCVCKVLTSSELVCASYDHIYVPIIMYCLRLFVVVLQELHCLQNSQYADAHLHMKIYILTKSHTYRLDAESRKLCVLES